MPLCAEPAASRRLPGDRARLAWVRRQLPRPCHELGLVQSRNSEREWHARKLNSSVEWSTGTSLSILCRALAAPG